ncbi:MAG: ribonuclease HII, partial [Chlamydiia bacterium]|nr:ribonuclease HII [Chlamydiia bacterium]
MPYDPERARLHRLLRNEKRLWKEGFLHIAGIDEVGRGPLAGPVVACACILPKRVYFNGLNDSKQVEPEERERLYRELTANPQVHYGLGIVDVETIDRINIFHASA